MKQYKQIYYSYIIHLILLISCDNKEGKGHIDVYDSKVSSYTKKKTIEDVYTLNGVMV